MKSIEQGHFSQVVYQKQILESKQRVLANLQTQNSLPSVSYIQLAQEIQTAGEKLQVIYLSFQVYCYVAVLAFIYCFILSIS